MLVGVPDGGLGVGGVLEFEDGQRQAVDKEHDVGAAVVAVLDHGELVDREPVVGAGVVGEHLDLCAADSAIGGAVLDLDAVDQEVVGGVVALDQTGAVDAGQLAQRLGQRGRRQVGVEAGQGRFETAKQDHLGVIGALGRGHAGREVGAVGEAVALGGEPFEGGLFEDVFVHGRGHGYTCCGFASCTQCRILRM